MSKIDTPRQRLEFVFNETASGNWQPFVDALADDAEWTVIGSTGWSKAYRGKQQILSDLFAPLRRVLAPPRKSHALYMIAEGNMVAVQGQGENTTRDGRRYDNTMLRQKHGAITPSVAKPDAKRVSHPSPRATH